MYFKWLLEVITDDTLDASEYSLRHSKSVPIFKNIQFGSVRVKGQKSRQNVPLHVFCIFHKSGLLSQSEIISKNILLPFNLFEISRMVMWEGTEIGF